MPTFRISTDDGKTYNVTADSADAAYAALFGDSDGGPAPQTPDGRRVGPDLPATESQMKEAEREKVVGAKVRAKKELGTGGAGRSFFNGLTFNFGDELAAGVGALADSAGQLLVPGKKFQGLTENYERNYEAEKRVREGWQQDNPVLSTGLELLGGARALGGPRLSGGGGATFTGPPVGSVKDAVKIGAAAGAVSGAGAEEGADRLTGAATGGVLGGITGGVFQKGIDLIAQKAAQKAAQAAIMGPPTNGVVAAGERMGVPVPRFVATESTPLRSATQVSRNVPTGGAVDDAMTQFVGDVGNRANRLGDMASSGGAVKDRATIGDNIRKSVAGSIDAMDTEADKAYAMVRKAINADKLVDVTKDVAPLLNQLMKIRQAAGEGALGGHLDTIADLITRPNGVSFNGLQRARSQLNRAINWDARNGGMSVGDLKRLKGSLNDALETAVRASAKNQSRQGRAVNLFKAADRRFGQTAETAVELKNLTGRGSDEGLVDKIVAMASDKRGGNISALRQLKQHIGGDNVKDLSGLLIQRLGANNKGDHSPALFLNRWEQMSEIGKRELFTDPAIRQGIEDLATLNRAMLKNEAFANRSQTGRTTGLLAAAAGIAHNPVGTGLGLLGGGLFSRIMSQPVTSKQMGDWARRMTKIQANVAKGEKGALKVANQVSRQYGVQIANSMNMPTAANDLTRALMGTIKSAAEGEDE